MAWVNPKTDWKAGDAPSSGDFNRIEENILYMLDEAGKVNTVNNKAPDANKNIQLVPADIGALPRFSVSSIDFNNLTTPGVYAISGGTNTNAPVSGLSFWGLIVLNSTVGSSGANYAQQIAFPEGATEIYIRRKQSTWYSWEILSLRQKSVVIGEGAQGHTADSNNSVAVGKNANARGDMSVALGADSLAYGTDSTAIGHNVSATSDRQGVLGTRTSDSGGTSNWIVPGDFKVQGTKTFEIPHPKPEKRATHVIRHACVESPTAGDTLYRWKIRAEKENDMVVIPLPDYFIYLNKDVQIFVTPQGHFGAGYGILNTDAENIEVHCQLAGEYNILVIGTRNDDNPTIQNWGIKGVEREIGEDWNGEAVPFDVDEIMEVVEIEEKEELK